MNIPLEITLKDCINMLEDGILCVLPLETVYPTLYIDYKGLRHLYGFDEDRNIYVKTTQFRTGEFYEEC